MFRTLWAVVQGEPEALVAFHKAATILWLLLIIPMVVFKWYEAIAFISVVSVYANTIGHWSAWQAARVEVKQDVADDG